jgi:25S rRNA (cytosine2278-C5)-methyltransferase
LSKRGIASPQNHPLRLAVERHKARLASELTKARLRRKCTTLEAFRAHVNEEKCKAQGFGLQPRWVRVNYLKTSLSEEIAATFLTYAECHTLQQLHTAGVGSRAYFRDPNIPDLLATNASSKDISSTLAYKSGKIILQDKASCFPAHLMLGGKPKFSNPNAEQHSGDILDACAAPGNKTTHVASILSEQHRNAKRTQKSKQLIFACERDAKRSETLQSMVDKAGAGTAVKVLAKQDFLALDPHDPRFKNVRHLLLDPSCSGSGILGREDIPNLVLPKDPRKHEASKSRGRSISDGNKTGPSSLKKRKRDKAEPINSQRPDTERLIKLSNLQTHIVEHAFVFPSARLITYSTCSIHAIENEMVAFRGLSSKIAKERGWRLLRRDEQPDGLRVWPHRAEDINRKDDGDFLHASWSEMTEEARWEFRNACIRCYPGGEDGTMGFFVVGFVRDPESQQDGVLEVPGVHAEDGNENEDEWGGFSGDEAG